MIVWLAISTDYLTWVHAICLHVYVKRTQTNRIDVICDANYWIIIKLLCIMQHKPRDLRFLRFLSSLMWLSHIFNKVCIHENEGFLKIWLIDLIVLIIVIITIYMRLRSMYALITSVSYMGSIICLSNQFSSYVVSQTFSTID